MRESQRPIPPVTEALHAEAATRPGGWVYAIDPHFEPADPVPPYGIIGAWKVDARGHLSEEFQHNLSYRPSPRSLNFPTPGDPVEAAVQLAVTGYGTETEMVAALIAASVYLVPGERPGILTYSDDAGRFLPVFTSPRLAPPSAPGLQTLAFRDLLPQLPLGISVKINPGSAASVRIPVAVLHTAATGET